MTRQQEITPLQKMQLIDDQLAHVWMVRCFLKHSDEAAEDQELCEIYRSLYDYMLALGSAFKKQDTEAYLVVATKRFRRLRKAADLFLEIQPEVSGHTNFKMAVISLQRAVAEIERLLFLI